jgi:GTP-binding protein Era
MDDDLREALTTLMLRAIHARGRVEMQTLEEGEEENQFTLKHAHPQDDEDVPREKFAIVLNKVDLVNPKKKMLTLATELGVIGDNCVKYGREPPSSHEEELAKFASLSREELFAIEKQFPPVFFISALEDDGVQDILNHLLRLATPSEEWTLEADQVTQMSPVERIEEVIREKLYRSLHREVPHQIEQMNRTYRTVENKEEGSKIVHIDQDLIVRTKSHLKLVMGRGGMTLKRIETAAKRDLIKLFDCSDVILHLHVKFTKSRHARPLDGQNVGVSQQVF